MNIVSGGRGELASYPTFFVCGIYRFFVLSTKNYRNFETAECCGNVLGKFRDNPSCTKLKLNLRKYELNSGSRIEWNVDILENIEYI